MMYPFCFLKHEQHGHFHHQMIFHEKLHLVWGFPIAMFDYRRVYHVLNCIPTQGLCIHDGSHPAPVDRSFIPFQHHDVECFIGMPRSFPCLGQARVAALQIAGEHLGEVSSSHGPIWQGRDVCGGGVATNCQYSVELFFSGNLMKFKVSGFT